MENINEKNKLMEYIIRLFDRTDRFWKYRKKALKYKDKVRFLYYYYYYLRCRKINRKLNSGIPVSEKIKEFNAPHGLSGIYISKNSVIEEGATIFQQVTIGSNTLKLSNKYGSPIINKNAYIGAGAKIIGKIIVGENVKIGANCIVVTDVPDNCTVVMEKPRIIENNNINKKNN